MDDEATPQQEEALLNVRIARLGGPLADKLSNDDVRRAVIIAVNDERIAAFLGRHDYEVEEVRGLTRPHIRNSGYGRFYKAARVTVELAQPISQ